MGGREGEGGTDVARYRCYCTVPTCLAGLGLDRCGFGGPCRGTACGATWCPGELSAVNEAQRQYCVTAPLTSGPLHTLRFSALAARARSWWCWRDVCVVGFCVMDGEVQAIDDGDDGDDEGRDGTTPHGRLSCGYCLITMLDRQTAEVYPLHQVKVSSIILSTTPLPPPTLYKKREYQNLHPPPPPTTTLPPTTSTSHPCRPPP